MLWITLFSKQINVFMLMQLARSHLRSSPALNTAHIRVYNSIEAIRTNICGYNSNITFTCEIHLRRNQITASNCSR